jgi:hypothetical protein
MVKFYSLVIFVYSDYTYELEILIPTINPLYCDVSKAHKRKHYQLSGLGHGPNRKHKEPHRLSMIWLSQAHDLPIRV